MRRSPYCARSCFVPFWPGLRCSRTREVEDLGERRDGVARVEGPAGSIDESRRQLALCQPTRSTTSLGHATSQFRYVGRDADCLAGGDGFDFYAGADETGHPGRRHLRRVNHPPGMAAGLSGSLYGTSTILPWWPFSMTASWERGAWPSGSSGGMTGRTVPLRSPSTSAAWIPVSWAGVA